MGRRWKEEAPAAASSQQPACQRSLGSEDEAKSFQLKKIIIYVRLSTSEAVIGLDPGAGMLGRKSGSNESNMGVQQSKAQHPEQIWIFPKGEKDEDFQEQESKRSRETKH